jgi:RNA polymerase II subunit A C-terminal domain phosphatase SSU72
MEAHHVLSKKGMDVKSFGTGSQVKLPGKSPDSPNTYPFTMSYNEIYQDLKQKDQAHYTQNGILNMLDRNRRLKERPERFQESRDEFDLVITVEERVYDHVVEFLAGNTSGSCKSVHIVNMDVQDNHDDATIGAFLIDELCQELLKAEDLDDAIEPVIAVFEEKHNKPLLHSIAFY